jgi:hypothetical protein
MLLHAICFGLLVCSVSSGLLGTNQCLNHSECRRTDYCDKSFLNPIGKCVLGKEDGGLCKDRHKCISKHCALFQCKSRKLVKDGSCKESAHCFDTQYCDNTKTCVDQKCNGPCTHDEQCVSNKCNFLRCAQSTARNCSTVVPSVSTQAGHTIVTTNITTIVTNSTKV